MTPLPASSQFLNLSTKLLANREPMSRLSMYLLKTLDDPCNRGQNEKLVIPRPPDPDFFQEFLSTSVAVGQLANKDFFTPNRITIAKELLSLFASFSDPTTQIVLHDEQVSLFAFLCNSLVKLLTHMILNPLDIIGMHKTLDQLETEAGQ